MKFYGIYYSQMVQNILWNDIIINNKIKFHKVSLYPLIKMVNNLPKI